MSHTIRSEEWKIKAASNLPLLSAFTRAGAETIPRAPLLKMKRLSIPGFPFRSSYPGGFVRTPI
ncbi:MAG: hypothetical protein M1510_02300 [Nitrospirae bacterium]|nr:hypothetical protein [Nitrospirota bacterium]MCL5237425.1 hypothetical protein [Nitrospirota bacterium]